MGLSNTTTSSKKIVTIINGKFTIRLADGDDNPNAVKRTLEKGKNAGKVVKELQYDTLAGKISKAYVDESEYGTRYITELDDDGNNYSLQINLDSSYFSPYAKRMPNINKDEEVVFRLGYDRERERHFLFIRQNDERVPMKFTKEEPNGMPEPTKKTVKGKEVWDWEEQENFLYEVAMDFAASLETSDVPF